MPIRSYETLNSLTFKAGLKKLLRINWIPAVNKKILKKKSSNRNIVEQRFGGSSCLALPARHLFFSLADQYVALRERKSSLQGRHGGEEGPGKGRRGGPPAPWIRRDRSPSRIRTNLHSWHLQVFPSSRFRSESYALVYLSVTLFSMFISACRRSACGRERRWRRI